MRNILLACAALLLASCQEAPAAYKPAALDFAGKPPIRLNVAQIRIVENYKSPMRAPNIEHELPVPPSQALKQWVNQRVQAVGTQGVFEFVIEDASVKETKLKKTQGMKGFFTDDQDAKYDANISVTMRLYDGVEAISRASGDVRVMRSKTINEKASINDRTRLFEGMTRDMMTAFDTEAQSRLRQYFAGFMR